MPGREHFDCVYEDGVPCEVVQYLARDYPGYEYPKASVGIVHKLCCNTTCIRFMQAMWVSIGGKKKVKYCTNGVSGIDANIHRQAFGPPSWNARGERWLGACLDEREYIAQEFDLEMADIVSGVLVCVLQVDCECWGRSGQAKERGRKKAWRLHLTWCWPCPVAHHPWHMSHCRRSLLCVRNRPDETRHLQSVVSKSPSVSCPGSSQSVSQSVVLPFAMAQLMRRSPKRVAHGDHGNAATGSYLPQLS